MGIKIGNNGFNRAFYGTKDLAAIAFGGSIVWRRVPAFKITVGINPVNVGQCTVTATGNVLGIVSNKDKSQYTITVEQGGNTTVTIIPKSGYQVQQLNVDKVGQGSLSSYTFRNVQADHTMYVWMEEAAVGGEPPEFTRSDVSGVTFNSLRKVLNSVMVDYPNGLDKDVTVLCTKAGIQQRVNKIDESSIYNAEIHNFNVGTRYCLTIDGGNKLTIDGDSLGGFYITESDNLIFRNMTFQNIFNWEKIYSPETFAAIYAVSQKNTSRNIYIENITVNGQSTITPNSSFRTFFGILIKGYRNVNIVNSNINKCGWCPVNVRNADVLNISKSYLSGDRNSGMSGHPYVFTLAEIRELHVEDCEITAPTFNEYIFNVSNTKNISIRRNYIHDSKGGLFSGSDGVLMHEFVMSYNYIRDLLLMPLYGWDCQWLALSGNIAKMEVANNLLKFTSTYYQEFFMRSGDCNVDRLINANNIFIRKGTNNSGLFLIGTVNELIADNNIYQLIGTLFYGIDSGIIISSSAGRNFDKIKEMGYETNSQIVGISEKILLSDAGGTRNCLNTSYAAQNKCLPDFVERFDFNYKENSPENSSIGCDNYYSAAFDENTDGTTGYEGFNHDTREGFSNSGVYTSPGGDLLVLRHKSPVRGKFVKFFVTSASGSHVFLGIGKNSAFNLEVNVDANGEYVSDNDYTIKIE